MTNNIDPKVMQALEAARKDAAENILPRFSSYDETTIKSIVTPGLKLEAHHHASLVFNKTTLQQIFPDAQIMGVMGKPTAGAQVSVLTRIGNRGIHIGQNGGYFQLSFLPGKTSDVSGTNHDPLTGKLSDEGVLFPPGMVNLKMFANILSDADLGQMEEIMNNFMDLDTGNTYQDKGKTKKVYRGTDLVVYFQGDYAKKNGNMEEIAITAIAIVNVKPKAAKQLRGWGKTPVDTFNARLLQDMQDEQQVLDSFDVESAPMQELGDGDIIPSELGINF